MTFEQVESMTATRNIPRALALEWAQGSVPEWAQEWAEGLDQAEMQRKMKEEEGRRIVVENKTRGAVLAMNFLLWKIVANALTVGSGVGSGVG